MELRSCRGAPSNWTRKPIGAVCARFTSGGTPSRAKPEFYEGGTIPWVKTKELDDRFLTETEESITDAGLRGSSAKLLDAGTILMAMYGATVGQLGILARPMCCNQACAAMQVDLSEADRDFLFYQLLLNRDHIIGSARGAAQQNLSGEQIKQFVLPFPHVKDQREIGKVLRALDDKIELSRRMNETLEAQARTLFRDWFVDFGPVKAKIAGNFPYLASDLWSLFPNRLEDGGVPQGWRRLHIGDLADLRGGKQLHKSAISASGRVPVFGGAGLMGYTTDHNADGYVITVGRVGAYCGQFFAHRGPAWVNNNASLIQPKQGISPEWLFLALRDLDVNVIKKGAAQPFISNGDLAALPVVLPTAEVMDAFLHLVLPLILMSENNAAEASILTHTRDLLLPKLMSGEIRIGAA